MYVTVYTVCYTEHINRCYSTLPKLFTTLEEAQIRSSNLQMEHTELLVWIRSDIVPKALISLSSK
jgi:hypothetical protein